MLEKFQTYITPILESFGENAIMQASFVIMVAFVIASIFKYYNNNIEDILKKRQCFSIKTFESGRVQHKDSQKLFVSF